MKLGYIVLFMLLISCNAVKKSTATELATKENTNVVATAKIIFLNYKVSKDSNNKIKVRLLNKLITEGKLKKNRDMHLTSKSNDFICVQLDKDLAYIEGESIANPLLKNVEYVDATGKLAKKQIALDTTEFFVRMQLAPKTKYISLKMVADPAIELLTIEL